MQANLSELKMKARFIFLFSASANVPVSCKQDISDMKTLMM